MTQEKRAYLMTRRPFMPEQGKIYENEGGGTFLCVKEGGFMDEYNAVMQNVKSGWTFRAVGCGMYRDGRIDWDYSLGGRFEEVQA